jgi:serine/threonine protein kinase
LAVARGNTHADIFNIFFSYGIFRQDENISVISLWAEYNLQTYLSENLNLELTKKLSIARGIANALKFIHKQDILHHDIRR